MGRLASVACALALSACTRPPIVFGERAPSECVGHRMNSDACMGWMFDRMMMGVSLRAYDDAAINAYVQEIGERVIRAAGDHRRWTFRVLDDEDPNAFAALGTTVYINRGILAVLRNEAELAGVIGHEVGHVLGGHAHEAFHSDGGVNHSDDDELRTLRGARDDEIQADEVAVVLARQAGYDPRAVETMLRALAAIAPAASAFDPHPEWPERIARVQAMIALHANPAGELGEVAYHTRIARLVIGEDPRVSTVLDGVAVFATAGFALELPPHHSAKTAGSGIVDAELESVSIDLRLVSAPLASMFARTSAVDTATETIIRGPVALAISVHGPRAAERAKALRDRVRAPRHAEVARLRPARVDLEAPRRLWMPAPTASRRSD